MKLEGENQQLQMLFEQRPSRPEDIEVIKMLQLEVIKRDDEIKKLNE